MLPTVKRAVHQFIIDGLHERRWVERLTHSMFRSRVSPVRPHPMSEVRFIN